MFLAWPLDDQDKALAWQEAERETCPACGTRKEEWGEWGPDGKFIPFDDPPYEAVSVRCPGCAALEREQTGRAKAPQAANYGVRAVLRRIFLGR